LTPKALARYSYLLLGESYASSVPVRQASGRFVARAGPFELIH
jgi:hypothetical protein